MSMNESVERNGKRCAEWLQKDFDDARGVSVLVNTSELEALLKYTRALEKEREELAETATVDVYLRGDWYVTILKMDLNQEQVRLLDVIGDRTKELGSNTIEVHEHNPEYPERNWRGHTRV